MDIMQMSDLLGHTIVHVDIDMGLFVAYNGGSTFRIFNMAGGMCEEMHAWTCDALPKNIRRYVIEYMSRVYVETAEEETSEEEVVETNE